MEFVNFLEKNQRLQYQIQAIILNITSCTTMCDIFILKKLKIQDFIGKTKKN
jgi:hypothetical protein